MSDIDAERSGNGSPRRGEPLVSVVIPVFNRRQLLSRALKSVCRQTVKDFEVIVVDDGSTDGSLEAVNELGDSRVRAIRSDANRGAAASRNLGVRSARGRYVAFLDSDDEWYRYKLASQLDAMRGAGALLSCSGYVLFRREGDPGTEVRLRGKDSDYPTLLFGCHLSPGSTMVLERTCFDIVGPFDTSLPRYEDWDWLMRATPRFPVLAVEAPLSRIHVAPPPPREVVESSLRAMTRKHARRLFAEHWSHGMRFVSGLLLERAGVSYRDSRPGSALLYGALALAVYPLRDRAFFAKNLQRSVTSARQLLPHRRIPEVRAERGPSRRC